MMKPSVFFSCCLLSIFFISCNNNDEIPTSTDKLSASSNTSSVEINEFSSRNDLENIINESNIGVRNASLNNGNLNAVSFYENNVPESLVPN